MRSLCRVCGSKEKLKYTVEELKLLQRSTKFTSLAGNICLDCEDRIRMYSEDTSGKNAANGEQPGYDEDELIVVDDDEHFYSMLDKEMRIKQQQRIEAVKREPIVVSDDEDVIVFEPVKTAKTTTPKKRKITYDQEAMIVVDTLTIQSSDDEMESPKKQKSAKLAGMEKAAQVTVGKSANKQIEPAQISPKKPVANGCRSETPKEKCEQACPVGPKSYLDKVTKHAKSMVEEIAKMGTCDRLSTAIQHVLKENGMLSPISSSDKSLQTSDIDSSAHKRAVRKSHHEGTAEHHNTTSKKRTSVQSNALDGNATAKKSKTIPEKLNGTLKSTTAFKPKSENSVHLLGTMNLSSEQPLTNRPHQETSPKKRTVAALDAESEDKPMVEPITKKRKENKRSNKQSAISGRSPKNSKKSGRLIKDSPKKSTVLLNGTLKVTVQPIEHKTLTLEMPEKNSKCSAKTSTKSDTHPVKADPSLRQSANQFVGRRSIKLNGKSAKQKEKKMQRLLKEVTPKKKLGPKTSNDTKIKRKTVNGTKVAKPMKTKALQKVSGKVNAASKTYKLKAAALGKINKTGRRRQKISQAIKPTSDKSTTSRATSVKDNPKESLKNHPCPECKQTFLSPQEAARHIRAAHPTHNSEVLKVRYNLKDNPLTQRLRYRKQITLYECTVCRTVHTSLQIHLKHIAEERLAARRLKRREKQEQSAKLDKPRRKRATKRGSSQPTGPKTVALTLICKHCALTCGGLIQLNRHYFMTHQAQEHFQLQPATTARRKTKKPSNCESLDINSNRNASTPDKALEASQA